MKANCQVNSYFSKFVGQDKPTSGLEKVESLRELSFPDENTPKTGPVEAFP